MQQPHPVVLSAHYQSEGFSCVYPHCDLRVERGGPVKVKGPRDSGDEMHFDQQSDQTVQWLVVPPGHDGHATS